MDVDQVLNDFFESDKQHPLKAEIIIRNFLSIQPQLQPELRRKVIAQLLSSFNPELESPITQSSPISFLTTFFSLIKFLGRSPAGSEELGREPSLRILLSFGGLERAAKFPNRIERDEDYLEEEVATEVDPLEQFESEALRCLCNTLTLHPASRELFPSILAENRSWMDGLVRLIDAEGAGFLAGRIIFLLTSQLTVAVIDLVESTNVIQVMANFSKRYIAVLRSDSASTLNSGPAPTSSDILQEHLKIAYNLMLQYGRHSASIATGPTSPPILSPPETSTDSATGSNSPIDSPQSVATDTDDVTEVGSIRPKVEEENRSSSPVGLGLGSLFGSNSNKSDSSLNRRKRFWETKAGSEKGKEKEKEKEKEKPRSKSPGFLGRRFGNTPKNSPPPVPALPKFVSALEVDGPFEGTLTLLAAQRFIVWFPHLLALTVLLPVGSNAKEPSRLFRHAADSLLNYPISLEELDGFETSWLQPVPGSSSHYSTLAPLPSKILDHLARVCEGYFPLDSQNLKEGKGPGHPDETIMVGVGECVKVEEILGPTMLLLRKLSLLAEPAFALKEILLPADIDRNSPLEHRTDLTGHLLRLLSSILLPNTAHGAGELLFNLCERDPVILCTEIGYGNASGFLQNINQLIALPNPNDPSSRSRNPSFNSDVSNPNSNNSTNSSRSDRFINPITGVFDLPGFNKVVEMSEEEKGVEAERLYALFDRMAKTGVMEVNNPVDKAKSEGRFEETTEEREEEIKKLDAKEEKDELEAEEEMRKWKERSMKK